VHSSNGEVSLAIRFGRALGEDAGLWYTKCWRQYHRGLSKSSGIEIIAFQLDIGLLFDICFEESLPGMHVTVSRLQ
jgi:hypothetical protein